MKVSIIIPVYNAEKLIHIPIKSLKKQTFKNFEVILVNDGSTDNSYEVIKQLISDDDRFKIITQENSGPGEARNNGIKQAKGKYIGFIDSDDYFDKTFLEKMIKKLEEDNSDIVICDTAKVDINGNILKVYNSKYANPIAGIEAFKDIMQSINITSLSPNKLFKKSLFGDISYPKNIIINEDSATIYKLMLKANKISFVNEVLFYYVQHSGSSMNSFNKQKLYDRLKVANIIKTDLIEKKLFTQYIYEYKVYYLLNVVLSGSLQVVKQSKNWEQDLKEFLNKCNFNIKDIFLLRKYHKKKMIALLLLVSNKKLFKYFADKKV